MNTHLLALSTALSILAVTPAFAQNTTPVDCTQQANKGDPACAPPQNNTASGQAATTTQMSAGEVIVPADRLNGAQVMSANDYIGKTVYDQAGNNIGDVNDLIISGDGRIQAVILGVGGFLGIGEKDVAVNASAVQIVQDGDNKRLVVKATKEALNDAPTYDKNNRRYADQTTGAGAGGTQSGGGQTTDQTGSTTTTTRAPNGAAVDCKDPANASTAACANQQQ